MLDNEIPTVRATSAQVRRAAGSPSLEKLKDTLATGWSVEDLDHMDGKAAIHMAAWQGCMDNLVYLVELGCDVNVISTAPYSFGKTPLFFACTRSRDEQVHYLLEQGAHVKIINNKGQSVLSIASSHLTAESIAKIQQAEQAQAHLPWQNFRASHSDGLNYGDLDPRFLDRPLQSNDNVTALAVNPTTRQSRKGNFLRHNPHINSREGRPKPPKRKQQKKVRSRDLSKDAEDKLNVAWERLELGFHQGNPQPSDLLTIIQVSDRKREAWMPTVFAKLKCLSENSSTSWTSVQNNLFHNIETTDVRLQQLIYKLSHYSTLNTNAHGSSSRATGIKSQLTTSIDRQHWGKAAQAVDGLSTSFFEKNSKLQLSLPFPAIWVDSSTSLTTMENVINTHDVLGIDTEWATTESNENVVATVQIACWTKKYGIIHAWVLDLLKDDENYQTSCRALLQRLFVEKILLGFAVGHDVPKLSRWLQKSLPRDNLIDVQRLFGSGRELLGLAKCANKFSSLPLSKKEQCSDWSLRPLSTSQLEYAALDAAILLAITAEKGKRQPFSIG